MISIRLAQNEQAGICRDSSTRFVFMQSSGVGEYPTSSDQGGSKNLPDASCAATCLDAQGGYSIPPDLQRTDSTRFLISRYDFLRSCCPPRPLQGVNTSHPASKHRAFSHQGVNSSLPVANRGRTVPLLLSGKAHSRRNRDSAQSSGVLENNTSFDRWATVAPLVKSTAALKDLLLAQRGSLNLFPVIRH